MSEIVHVGMAEYKICASPQKITTLGLGSCLGVVLYDSAVKICGMAHIMMPDSAKISYKFNRMKFADTCLQDMYRDLLRGGARPAGLIAKLAGGACMFSQNPRLDILNIGKQNVEGVHKVLKEWRIPIVSEDVGNTYGRTIEFDTVTGELLIHAATIGDRVI